MSYRYEGLTDKEFTNELRLIWQNSSKNREQLSKAIREYFNQGITRQSRIIQKLQDPIEN